jgi:flagellar secretion chaperone FliS
MNPQLSYREAAVRGASPVRLVILLYEQAIADLRRALAALKNGDIEARTQEINHALLVIGHLQASLDKEHGGQVAANLDRFYNQQRTGLMKAQFQQSATLLEQQLSHLMLVHQAWCEVDRSTTAATAPSPAQPQAEGGQPARTLWTA